MSSGLQTRLERLQEALSPEPPTMVCVVIARFDGGRPQRASARASTTWGRMRLALSWAGRARNSGRSCDDCGRARTMTAIRVSGPAVGRR